MASDVRSYVDSIYGSIYGFIRHRASVYAPWSRVITRIPYSFWGITNTYYYPVQTKYLNISVD